MKKIGKISSIVVIIALVMAGCSPGAKVVEKVEETKVVEKAEAPKEVEKTEMADEAEMMDEAEMTDEAKEADMTEEDMTMKNDGDPSPDFSLMNLQGETVSLGDFKGEKVYVKYWASWCPICISGLSELDKLAGMDKDFEVISIVTPNYTGEKSVEDFKEWFKMKSTENLTVLFDVDGIYAKQFGVRAVPTSAYIGSDGVLVKLAPGHASNEQIQEAFNKIH